MLKEKKDSKYMDAWVLLEQYLIKGMEIPKEILYTLYELVEKYYSEEAIDLIKE